jgi:subtilisin-like proprotein convertase family protein
MTLSQIKQVARNENKNNLYIAIELLCDYIENLEISMVKPNGEPVRASKKKGSNNDRTANS